MMVHDKTFRLKVTCFSSATFLKKVDRLTPRWRRAASFAVIITFGIFIYHQLQLIQPPRTFAYCEATTRFRGVFYVFPSVPSLAAFYPVPFLILS